MGCPAQSVDLKAVCCIASVPALAGLWEAIRPHMREVDYSPRQKQYIRAICLTGADASGVREISAGETKVFLARKGFMVSIPYNDEFAERYGVYGEVSVAVAMRRLSCSTLEQFHNLIRDAFFGHLRAARKKATERANRMANIAPEIAALRFSS